MAERLGEVPELSPRDGVVLLSEEAHVIPDGEEPLEKILRLVATSLERVVVREPEGAGQEGPLALGETVDLAGRLRVVSEDEPIVHELLLDRAYRPLDTAVRDRQEPDERYREEARVELLAAVGLREGVSLRV